MSNKWRVAFDNHVLGHFAAKTPEEAVSKALDKHQMQATGLFTIVRAGDAKAKVYEVIR